MKLWTPAPMESLLRDSVAWSRKRWSRRIDAVETLAYFAAKRAVNLYIARRRKP